MKNIIRITLAVILALVLCGGALAESVYVTISSGEGKLVLPYAKLEVSDLDGDGALTVNDALIAAHDAHYEGGAGAGFHSEVTEYGISLYCLWGEENGGSYGYSLNEAPLLSLADPIHDGDSIHAYAYQDLEGWSDIYCYFDAPEMVSDGVRMTLIAYIYDENWTPVPTPVEGAIITINGEDSSIVTGADGSFTISHADSAPGEYIISARSNDMTLVPPVMVARVS